jgi:hypothetical protein
MIAVAVAAVQHAAWSSDYKIGATLAVLLFGAFFVFLSSLEKS